MAEERYQLQESTPRKTDNVESSASKYKIDGQQRRALSARRLERRSMRTQAVKAKPKKKMSGIGFWFIVGCALVKDVLDLLLHITVILSFIILFLNFLIGFIVLIYLWFSGVAPSTKKVATLTITTVAEFLPGLSILPMATLNILLIRFFENNEHAKKLATIKLAPKAA